MNFQRGRKRDDPEINLIPLIDVLLVILIFLMVTTTYARFSELKINLPTSGGEQTPTKPKQIDVTVDASGNYQINDTALTQGSIEALSQTLKREAGADTDPVLVWTEGAVVSWGNGDLMESATLPKIIRCERVQITTQNIYIGAEGTSERRLLRIDRTTGTVFPHTASSTHSASFPGGPTSGAAYRGRLVGADDLGALWLVEETAPGAASPARAILVSVPNVGESTVLLEHITGASAFFTTEDAFYWQERDALLTAPRSGGAASIAGHLPGTAGAIDSGFIYFIEGTAIQRLHLDALD